MSDPLKLTVEAIAETVSRYPDMKLRLIIRQAIISATRDNMLGLDEAGEILQNEVDYLKRRINTATEVKP